MVQWLRLRASTAGGTGSIPGWGTKILHAARCGQKKKFFFGLNYADEDGNCTAAVYKACAFCNYLYAKITFAHHVQPGGRDLIHSAVSHPLPFS